MKDENLRNLMLISIEGPPITEFDPVPALVEYKQEKLRDFPKTQILDFYL